MFQLEFSSRSTKQKYMKTDSVIYRPCKIQLLELSLGDFAACILVMLMGITHLFSFISLTLCTPMARAEETSEFLFSWYFARPLSILPTSIIPPAHLCLLSIFLIHVLNPLPVLYPLPFIYHSCTQQLQLQLESSSVTHCTHNEDAKFKKNHVSRQHTCMKGRR